MTNSTNKLINVASIIADEFEYTNEDFCGLSRFNHGHFIEDGKIIKIQDTDREKLTYLIECEFPFYISVEYEIKTSVKLHDYVMFLFEEGRAEINNSYMTLDYQPLLEDVNKWLKSEKNSINKSVKEIIVVKYSTMDPVTKTRAIGEFKMN